MADIVFPGSAPSGVVGEALMPQNLDLRIYQGDDFDVEIQLQDTLSNPIDLTGYVGSAQFRRSYEDNAPITATVTISPDGLNMTLSLSSVQTGGMSGSYIYDLQLTNASGKKRTYLTGDVEVSREVTK